MRKFINLALFTFIGSSCHNGGNASLTGHFEGYFEYRNKKLYTAITFESPNNKLGACISVPANLLLNKPFTTVEYNAPVIQLKMKDGDLPVNIVATLAKNNIDGKLDGNIPASIHLTKVENYIEPAKAYTIKEIILDNNGTKLLSNLYLPKKQFPSGAIIMVAGSGNHTKEEYNGAADLFASRGIATLTFDKRNVTDAKGLHIKYVNADITSMEDLVSDVETAFNFLKTYKHIDRTKIGLMGFSLGAVEVPVVAARHPDIAFIVAVSGNATTDSEFIINQGLNKYRGNNYDVETLKKAEDLYNDLFIYAKTRLNEEALQTKLNKAYLEKWGQLCFPPQVPNKDELKYLLSWNNFEFDPADYWKKINVPCLVVYGEKDNYIPVVRSLEILNKVFYSKKALLTLKVYANADHTIRTIPTKGEFSFPQYADGYINNVMEWLLKQTK